MSDRRRIAYPVLLVGFGLVAWSFWPGLLTPDSNQTIYQAGADFSSDWWTAFGAIVLRWWLDLQLGLGTVYGLGIALNVIGLYLCCRAAFRRLPAAAATVAFTTFPPMAAQLSGLSRDTFFLGFSLCAFGCFGAMLRPTTRQRRRQLVFAGLLLAFLGFLCRQNGIVVVLVLAGLAVAQGELRWLAWLRPLRGRRTAIVTGAVAACLLAFIASQLIYTVAGTKRVHPERVIYLYDLASISTLSGENQFPAELQRHHPGWVTQQVDQHFLEANFKWPNVITLFPNNAAGKIDFQNTDVAALEAPKLQHAWVTAITHHPLEYLWGRIRLTGSQLGIVERPTDAYIPLLDPSNFQHPLRSSGNYHDASSYLTTFVSPSADVPLDLPFLYVGLSILFGVVLWRRRGPLTRLGTAMAVSSVANTVIMGTVAMASAFRYTNLAVSLTCVLALYVLVTSRRVTSRAPWLVAPWASPRPAQDDAGLSASWNTRDRSAENVASEMTPTQPR